MTRGVLLVMVLQLYEVVPGCVCGQNNAVSLPRGNSVAMGTNHGCSVTDGVVACFGENKQGELGRGTRSDSEPRPMKVDVPEPVAALALGNGSSCALTVSGTVWCWGKNDTAQLGQPPSMIASSPVQVVLPVAAKQISLTDDTVMALSSDGRLFAWGNDREGPFGRGGSTGPALQPKEVSRAAPGLTFDTVTTGGGNVCGVDSARALWCWGRNAQGQLGLPSTVGQYREPQKVLTDVDQVDSSEFITCIIRRGELWCFGNDDNSVNYPEPTRIDIAKSVRQVDARFLHLCAVDVDDGLWCWGRGVEGQLGLGNTTSQTAPQKVGARVSQVAVGGFSTCARATDNRILCMGKNEDGQLGDGSTTRNNLPSPQ